MNYKSRMLEFNKANAFRRVLSFYKLVRHKIVNGNLPWEYRDYAIPLLAHYKKIESLIEKEKRTDRRWWDRKSPDYKAHLQTPIFVFNRHAFSDELRQIVKETEEKIKTEKRHA